MSGQRHSIYKPPQFGRPYVRPEAQRPSASQRGYDRMWRIIRAKFLKAYPSCACGAQATEVDHILAKSKGGTNAWQNLQPMCKLCHARKTVAVDGGLGKKNRSGSSAVDHRVNETYVSTEFMFGDEIE